MNYTKGIIIIFIFFAAFFTIRIWKLNTDLSQQEGKFSRKIIDTIDYKSANWIDFNNKRFRFYINLLKKSRDSNETLEFLYLPDSINALDVKLWNDQLNYIDLDRQTWSIKKAGFKDQRDGKIKLPSFTFRALLLDSSKLILKQYDFKAKRNKLILLNDKGEIQELPILPFTSIQDGGLATDGDLLSDAEYFYFIPHYNSLLYKISKDNFKAEEIRTIEKINEYPKITNKGNTYSFTKAPLMIHSGAVLTNKFIVIYSLIRDEITIKQLSRSNIFLDFYDKVSCQYQSTVLLTNVRPEEIAQTAITDSSLTVSTYTKMFTCEYKNRQ